MSAVIPFNCKEDSHVIVFFLQSDSAVLDRLMTASVESTWVSAGSATTCSAAVSVASILIVSEIVTFPLFSIPPRFINFYSLLPRPGKGLCVRGDQCPFDHGVDPVVVDGGALPQVLGMGGPPVVPNFPPPMFGGPPPDLGMHIPPPGYLPPFGVPPPMGKCLIGNYSSQKKNRSSL